MRSTLRLRSALPAGLAALALVLSAGAARAQDQPAEFPSWRLPGWTFTPGVAIGVSADSNVTVGAARSANDESTSDQLYRIQPSGQLEYFSPRTSFSTGYLGSLRRYLTLDQLDGTDHRAYVSVRRLLSRRVTIFADNSFIRVPTTDLLELNGIPFRRTGARYDGLTGGVEARLTRTTDLTARYELTWVDFERKDAQLTGGTVNGLHGSLSHRFTGRSSLGAEYGVRWASLNEGTRDLAFQEAGAVYRYLTSPLTSLEIAGGFARLDDATRGIVRNGPYLRLSVNHRAERATLGLGYSRSYVPSVSLGGSTQSQEFRGFVQMPLSRNRFYVQESAAWRRTDPLDPIEVPLDSTWIRTLGGYEIQRWLRLEAYYTFTRQDTRLAGGLISRHQVGAQLVVSEPMRIR